MKNNFTKKRVKINNFEVLLIIILILIGFFFNYYSSKDLKSIPTCLYGCDYYYENGIALDLFYNPTHLYQSSSHDWLGFINTLPKSSAFLEYLTSFVTNYRGLSYWKNLVVLYYFLIIVGVIGWYLFYKKIFINIYLSFFLTFLTLPFYDFPSFKYSHSFIFILPWLLYLMIHIFGIKKINKEVILKGIALIFLIVLLFNYHAMLFFITFFFLGFGYLIFVILPIKKKKINLILSEIFIKLKSFKSIYIITITLISLFLTFLVGWWYRVIFIYGGDKNSFKYDAFFIYNTFHRYFYYLFYYVKKIFWVEGNYFQIILNILFIISIIFYVVFFEDLKRKNKNLLNISLWITITYLFSVFHYLVTIPLFGKQLSPGHAYFFLNSIFRVFFIGLFFYILLKLNFIVEKKREALVYLFFLLIFVISIISNFSVAENKLKGKFWMNGYNVVPIYYRELNEFFRKNNINPNNIVVITTNELSFALHSLFATKLLTGRQSHFFHFGDFQKLWLDTSIIFYGNNSGNREKLLKEYYELAKKSGKDLYLYWDYSWVNSEWQQYSNKQIFPFDPFRFEDNLSYRKILEENGIKYFVTKNDIFEPSARNNKYANRLNIIYVSYENYYNFTNPWKPDLNKYLKKVWSYKNNDVEIAKLYKIILN